jgi:O-antigen/teichoic acid export membrane protein
MPLRPLGDGLKFMFGQTLSAITQNFDRVLVAALLGNSLVASVYLLLSRADQLSGTPVVIFFRTHYHRFFEERPAQGHPAVSPFMREMLLLSTGIGLGAGCLAAIAYWVLVNVVLTQYRGSEMAFAVLCLSQPAIAIYYCFGNLLVGRRRLMTRNLLDMVAVALLLVAIVIAARFDSVLALVLGVFSARYAIAASSGTLAALAPGRGSP